MYVKSEQQMVKETVFGRGSRRRMLNMSGRRADEKMFLTFKWRRAVACRQNRGWFTFCNSGPGSLFSNIFSLSNRALFSPQMFRLSPVKSRTGNPHKRVGYHVLTNGYINRAPVDRGKPFRYRDGFVLIAKNRNSHLKEKERWKEIIRNNHINL